jgi:hypothetical protein
VGTVPQASENYVDCPTRWIRFFFAPLREFKLSASLGELFSRRKLRSLAIALERTVRANDPKATATYGHREPTASFEFFG